jgi:hypothetical protein
LKEGVKAGEACWSQSLENDSRVGLYKQTFQFSSSIGHNYLTVNAENLPELAEAQQAPQIQPKEPTRIPKYSRDLHPKNLILSADDLREFFELLDEINTRAQEIEYTKLDLSTFDSPEHAKQRVLDVMPLEFNYLAGSGDSVQGLGVPRTDDRTFPDNLVSIFGSNAAYTERAINLRPLNTVEVFLCFEKPSLKLDFQTLPSNPTENRSIININGRDEDWVISTAERLQNFFKQRATTRPIIHGSGTYDYFVYLAFLPSLIWLFFKQGSAATVWLEQQSIFLNIVLGIYTLLLSLLIARFVFQYARWLFPPMEYYKRSRVGAFVHRSIAGVVGSTIFLGAIYDLVSRWLPI